MWVGNLSGLHQGVECNVWGFRSGKLDSIDQCQSDEVGLEGERANVSRGKAMSLWILSKEGDLLDNMCVKY